MIVLVTERARCSVPNLVFNFSNSNAGPFLKHLKSIRNSYILKTNSGCVLAFAERLWISLSGLIVGEAHQPLNRVVCSAKSSTSFWLIVIQILINSNIVIKAPFSIHTAIVSNQCELWRRKVVPEACFGSTVGENNRASAIKRIIATGAWTTYQCVDISIFYENVTFIWGFEFNADETRELQLLCKILALLLIIFIANDIVRIHFCV
mmetsp:Transcript_19263/g.42833  ORF Transcript_19263/g.42833 Transcript_19263/m.42833 type:complete len:207 (-) Transcript_19263:419-1039(-)